MAKDTMIEMYGGTAEVVSCDGYNVLYALRGISPSRFTYEDVRDLTKNVCEDRFCLNGTSPYGKRAMFAGIKIGNRDMDGFFRITFCNIDKANRTKRMEDDEYAQHLHEEQELFMNADFGRPVF